MIVTCKRCKTPLIFSRCHNASCKNFQHAWSRGSFHALLRGQQQRRRRLARAG